MKNAIRILGIIALITVIGFTVIACGGSKPNGTYYNEEYKTSYTFSGNKMTMDTNGYVIEGTFDAKDGKLIVTTEYGISEIDYTLKGKELTISVAGVSFVLIKK